jgi:mutator protein MutT
VDYQNPRPCVGCFIHDAGRVLLSRRAVEPARGEWDLVGGFIEPGETAEDAVRREVREETTLRVEPAAYLGSLPDVYGDRDYPTLNLIYLVRRVSGDPKPKDDVAELGWFEIDAIPDLAFPHQLQAVRLLRHHLGRADR